MSLSNLRTPDIPPKIEALSDLDRPLISVMIPAFNCLAYVEQTLISVINQIEDFSIFQIEIVDDHSTDGDLCIITEKYSHLNIGYFRQEKNVGSLRNFETCINRAKGHWIHILHGDDMVKEGFYREIFNLIKAFPNVGAVFTDYIYMNEKNEELYALPALHHESGILDNWFETISKGQRIQPPAIVVKRSVYEDLGSFFGVHYGEDWEMWVRIASKYDFAYSPKYLALYRLHQNNITSRSFLSNDDIKSIIKVVNIIQHYWPIEKRKMLRQEALKNFSQYFAKISDKIYHDYGSPQAAHIHVWKSFLMHQNQITLKYFIKITIKRLIRYRI